MARAADLIGVQWRSPAAAGIELRFCGDGGSWSRWVSAIGCAGGHAHGPDGPSAQRFASPEALALFRLNALDAHLKGAFEQGFLTLGA